MRRHLMMGKELNIRYILTILYIIMGLEKIKSYANTYL